MKRIILSFCLLFAFSCAAHATTVLYRLSSGEVLNISLNDNDFEPLDSFFGVLIDPPFSNGTDWRDSSGNDRVFGYAKINDNGTVRNATQVEIDGFLAARETDRSAELVQDTINYLNNNPIMKRIFKALAKAMNDDLNELRQQAGLQIKTFNQFKTQVLDEVN